MSFLQIQLILKRALGRREHDCCRSCLSAGRDETASLAFHRYRTYRSDRWAPTVIVAALILLATGGLVTAYLILRPVVS